MTGAASHVRQFTGRTMAEVLERVRERLGPGAVVLQARHVRARKWWGARTSAVEVTAGLPARLGPETPHPSGLERRADSPGQIAQTPLALEVAELRGAVQSLLKRGEAGLPAERPEMAQLRKALVSQGLPENLVSGLIERVKGASGGLPTAGEVGCVRTAMLEGPPVSHRSAERARSVRERCGHNAAGSASQARSSMLSLIERLIPTTGPVRLVPRRCSRVALIGPTGVGKTTSIAKLAAHFRVREHRTVGLIAADTYRIGAVDQLRRYAELMGSPVRVVRSPGEVARAAAALAHNDVVFIDTAGRSQRDDLRMEELRRLLDAARSDEVHLVLSLTSDSASLFSAIDRFVPLGADRLILTKLDEAERTGAILQASARARLPVSYVTTGQEVPEDIEVAASGKLARLVLDGPGSSLRRAWDGSETGGPLGRRRRSVWRRRSA